MNPEAVRNADSLKCSQHILDGRKDFSAVQPTLEYIYDANKMWRSFFKHDQTYSMNRFQEVKNMKKLLICCLFGNTANSLAKKMHVLAESSGNPLMISAVGLDNFASVAPAFDGFLIAPHIQYKLSEIYDIVGNTRPIAIIESLPYASLDAEKVLNFVKEKMPELAA